MRQGHRRSNAAGRRHLSRFWLSCPARASVRASQALAPRPQRPPRQPPHELGIRGEMHHARSCLSPPSQQNFRITNPTLNNVKSPNSETCVSKGLGGLRFILFRAASIHQPALSETEAQGLLSSSSSSSIREC